MISIEGPPCDSLKVSVGIMIEFFEELAGGLRDSGAFGFLMTFAEVRALPVEGIDFEEAGDGVECVGGVLAQFLGGK